MEMAFSNTAFYFRGLSYVRLVISFILEFYVKSTFPNLVIDAKN